MIFRHALLAAVITGLAAAAHAQTPPSASPATPPAATSTTKPMPGSHAADAKKLIGRNVKNADGDTIGEIKSVYISSDGTVDSVMVGVGGFLGVGEREVQLAWKELQIADNGEKVTVNMSKDQLKAMAPYTYKDTSWRGNVFSDRGLWTEDQRAARDARATADTGASVNRDRTMADSKATTATSPAATTTPPAATASTESTGDFNAAGDMSANAVIGTKVRNDNKDTVGAVQDLYIDGQGAIKTVVVSVGGFLGIGAKDVAIKWSDLKQSRDGKSLVLMTNLSKDELKALPDYTAERRVPTTPDQAAAPK
ncbi:PRC-barrel domain-containing protein [Reyranella sp.]|uniref:PRC-barrel domain-containing protein n=1 Tax=Reyranella sp. TaxID=1929291 RepID=UPI003D0BFBB8